MKLFKSLLSIVLLVMLTVSPVFAQARNGIQSSKGIESSQALVLPAGTWLYGVKVYADASSSFVAVYDAATYVGKTVADAVDEVGEATQYESVTVWYPKPIYCANGVSVYIATGVAYLYYGPPPSN